MSCAAPLDAGSSGVVEHMEGVPEGEMIRASWWLRLVAGTAVAALTLSGCAHEGTIAPAGPPAPLAATDCEPVSPPKPEPEAQSSQRSVRRIATFSETAAQIAELRKAHGAARVLIVLDLDNTMLTSRSELGSDAWYTWQETIHKTGAPACAATEPGQLLIAQGLLYGLGRMHPTEPATESSTGVVSFVRDLQSAGHPAIVLTSRGPEFNDVTRRELRKWGFSFADSAIGPRGGYPAELRIVPETAAETAKSLPPGKEKLAADVTATARATRYEDGVFMTAGQHKGAMLRLLLTRTGSEGALDAVVFVDDTQKHTERMRDAFDKSRIAVHTYHYVNPDVLSPASFMQDPAKLTAAAAAWERLRRELAGLYGYDPLDPLGP